jgi:heat shock protein HtpX
MQGAGYMNYQEAYRTVKGGQAGIIPGSGLSDDGDAGIRKAFDDSSGAGKKSVKRNTGDLMMAVYSYTFIDCQCGLRIKVPPDYGRGNIDCPRCGARHTIQK